MLETLFALGVALIVAAVAIWLLKLVFAVLWLPVKIVAWVAGGIGSLIGGLICLVLLPFALAGALVTALLAIVFNPIVLLGVIAVLAWIIHTQQHRDAAPRLPDATNGT